MFRIARLLLASTSTQFIPYWLFPHLTTVLSPSVFLLKYTLDLSGFIDAACWFCRGAFWFRTNGVVNQGWRKHAFHLSERFSVGFVSKFCFSSLRSTQGIDRTFHIHRSIEVLRFESLQTICFVWPSTVHDDVSQSSESFRPIGPERYEPVRAPVCRKERILAAHDAISSRSSSSHMVSLLYP